MGAAIGTNAGNRKGKEEGNEYDQLTKDLESEIAVIQANYEVTAVPQSPSIKLEILFAIIYIFGRWR